MGRPKSDNPRNIVVAVRLTKDQANAIDELRGSWSRLQWVRNAMTTAAKNQVRGPR